VWDCKYHVVWTTKYRYEVLEGAGRAIAFEPRVNQSMDFRASPPVGEVDSQVNGSTWVEQK